jgi:hypothetical protein
MTFTCNAVFDHFIKFDIEWLAAALHCRDQTIAELWPEKREHEYIEALNTSYPHFGRNNVQTFN